MSDHAPSMEDCTRMWEAIEFPRLAELNYPNVVAYVQALEAVYVNGSVEFLTFEMPSHPTFDWYSSRRAFHEMGFFQNFWSASSVRSIFPFDLKSAIDLAAPDVFVSTEPSTLGESLTLALTTGGAYGSHAPGSLDAQARGDAAAAELLGTSGDGTQVYICQLPWCDFFWDVIWDWTWVVIDLNARRIHLLCATDSD